MCIKCDRVIKRLIREAMREAKKNHLHDAVAEYQKALKKLSNPPPRTAARRVRS